MLDRSPEAFTDGRFAESKICSMWSKSYRKTGGAFRAAKLGTANT